MANNRRGAALYGHMRCCSSPLGSPILYAGVQVSMQEFCWTFAESQRTAVTSVWIQREQTPKDLTHWEQTMQGLAAAQQHQANPLHQRYATSETFNGVALGVLHA